MPPVFNQTNFYEPFIIYATIVEGLFVEVEGTNVFYFHYIVVFELSRSNLADMNVSKFLLPVTKGNTFSLFQI
jgi:hypothetical protein